MSAAKPRRPFAYAEEEEIDTELTEHLDEEGFVPALAEAQQINDLMSSRAGKTYRSNEITRRGNEHGIQAYILFFLPKSEATGKRMNTRAPPGPLLQYGPYLNGVLSLLIGLSSLMIDDKAMDHDGFWLLCLLPVDIESLERLKYPYKGA
ncbi:MAG: hypothetical protein Q9204_001382 [Flavoplaca sp. TL-2023a]